MTCSACPNRKEAVCALFKKRVEPENYCVVSDRDPATFKLAPEYSGRGFDGERYVNPEDAPGPRYERALSIVKSMLAERGDK
jgi:hypothetical protein